MKKLACIAFITLLLASCSKEVKQEATTQTDKSEVQPTVPLCAAIKNDNVPRREAMRLQNIPFLVYLNFNGASVSNTLWNDGRAATIVCAPSGVTPADQLAIVKGIQQLYSPFKILITNDPDVYNNYPATAREEGIITPTYQWFGYYGGVAYIGSYLFRQSTPFFAFSSLLSDYPLYIQDAVEHEMGHTYGLLHQAQFSSNGTYLSDYNPGYGYGPLSFVPVMGAGYDKHIHNWFTGLNPYSAIQDDYSRLSDVLGNADDDYPDVIGGHGEPLKTSFDGVINKAGDVDCMKIVLNNTAGISAVSDRVDIKLYLYKMDGTLVATSNDAYNTNTFMAAKQGAYYLKVEAVSNQFVSSRFLTGTYHIDMGKSSKKKS